MSTTTTISSSSDRPGKVPGLHDAASRAAWDNFIADAAFRPSTREVYRSYALRFLRWLARQEFNLASITAPDVEKYLAGLDVLPASKGMYRTALRRFFDVLVAHGVVRANPADHARLTADAPVGVASPEPVSTNAEEQSRRETHPTLAELNAAVRALDPAAMDGDAEMLDAGVVLLAGLHLGTDKLGRLSRFTRVPHARVAKFARRLRVNGVWTANGKTAARWDDEEGGCIELIIDILIAMGMVESRPADRSEDRSNQDENVTIQEGEGA